MNASLNHPAVRVILSLIVAGLIATSAAAQSSSRSVLPTVTPQYQPQPTYTTPAPQYTTPPQYTAPQYTAPQATGSVNQYVPSQAMPMQQGTSTGSSTRTMPPMAAAAPAQTFESKLWSYLLRSKYRYWAPVPGKSDAMYEGQSPHGAFLMMYLNRKAAGNASTLPVGSIIVKENYTPAKDLAAVTVMYKSKNYHAKAGDWYWVKYNPDGTVASKQTDSGAKRLAGRVGGCIDCHSGADGGDFVFFND